jgi:hypothetical protein
MNLPTKETFQQALFAGDARKKELQIQKQNYDKERMAKQLELAGKIADNIIVELPSNFEHARANGKNFIYLAEYYIFDDLSQRVWREVLRKLKEEYGFETSESSNETRTFISVDLRLGRKIEYRYPFCLSELSRNPNDYHRSFKIKGREELYRFIPIDIYNDVDTYFHNYFNLLKTEEDRLNKKLLDLENLAKKAESIKETYGIPYEEYCRRRRVVEDDHFNRALKGMAAGNIGVDDIYPNASQVLARYDQINRANYEAAVRNLQPKTIHTDSFVTNKAQGVFNEEMMAWAVADLKEKFFGTPNKLKRPPGPLITTNHAPKSGKHS